MTPNVIRNINKLKHQIFSDFKGGNFYDAEFSSTLYYALAFYSLCRVREIVFEKKRETLLLGYSYFISKAARQ